MRLRNVLTVASLAVFGSMTLFGAVTYASDVNPLNQNPIDAPPQVHQPSVPKADEPESVVSEVPNTDPTPAPVEKPQNSKAHETTQPNPETKPASKPEIELPRVEKSVSEPEVEKPERADKPVKPKKSEQVQREKDSESGEKEETRLVTVSHPVEDQPASKQDVGESNSEPKESDVEVATNKEPVVADNSQEQANASESSSDQEEAQADDQKEPKTANGGKMEQTGSETVSLLLISIGVMGMGATLTVHGWKGA